MNPEENINDLEIKGRRYEITNDIKKFKEGPFNLKYNKNYCTFLYQFLLKLNNLRIILFCTYL